MEKTTAVEWLVEKYIESGVIFLDDINQAKEIEKQQIIDARETAPDSYGQCIGEAEQYYQKTFKK
jgi:hypothetical protein